MLVLTLITILIAVALSSVHSNQAILIRTTTLVLLTSGAMVTNAFNWYGVGSGLSLYSNTVIATGISTLCTVLLMVLGGLVLQFMPTVNSYSSSTTVMNVPTFPLFALFSVIGGAMLVASADMITVYVALELQSFALYVMAALNRDSESSTHSGLMYFMLGGLSSCFVLLGFALVYSDTGITCLDSAKALLTTTDGVSATDTWTITMGMIAMGTGFLFKITAAPFHHWGPDVYDGVPTVVTTWLSIMPKVSVLGLFIYLSHVFTMASVVGGMDLWVAFIMVSSVLSMVVGTVVGLAQVRIKRLMAYSTISHVGFMLLAMAMATEDSMVAYAFYLMQYTVTSLMAFGAIIAIGYAYDIGDISTIKGMANAFKSTPGIAVTLAVALFSMAGVPPLLGFYGKQLVLYAAINNGYTFSAILGVVTSVISASYYLYVVRVVYFEEGHKNPIRGNITLVHSYVLSLLTMGVVSFIASPSLLLDLSRLVAMSTYSH